MKEKPILPLHFWHPGASRGGGALTCPGVSQPRPPNFNVVDSGLWKLQKDHVFEIEKVIIEIGGRGASLPKKLRGFIHLRAAPSYFLVIKAGKGIWIQQGCGRLIRRPLQ